MRQLSPSLFHGRRFDRSIIILSDPEARDRARRVSRPRRSDDRGAHDAGQRNRKGLYVAGRAAGRAARRRVHGVRMGHYRASGSS